MALAAKCDHLFRLQPDIAVIPECSLKDLRNCSSNALDCRWFGDNPRKGLGVLVAKPLRIRRASPPRNRWIAPLTISGGAVDFLLVAVWAMPAKGSSTKSYIGQVYEAVAHNRRWFARWPVLLCGDLNSNVFWDHHRKTGNHSAVVRLLEHRGLVSAYHHFFSESQGGETRPTYYFWHRQDRGYHID